MLTPPSYGGGRTSGFLFGILAGILALASLLMPRTETKRRRAYGAFAAISIVFTTLAIAGRAPNGKFSSEPSTPAGTSQVQVTATTNGGGGNVSHSASTTLTVQK